MIKTLITVLCVVLISSCGKATDRFPHQHEPISPNTDLDTNLLGVYQSMFFVDHKNTRIYFVENHLLKAIFQT